MVRFNQVSRGYWRSECGRFEIMAAKGNETEYREVIQRRTRQGHRAEVRITVAHKTVETFFVVYDFDFPKRMPFVRLSQAAAWAFLRQREKSINRTDRSGS